MRTLTAQEIAALVDGECVGDPDAQVQRVASLEVATADCVAFLANEKYRSQVLPSAATVVLVPQDFAEAPPAGRAWVRCARPSAGFSLLIEQLIPPPPRPEPGVHPAAVVHASAQVDPSAAIGPCAVIAAGAVVGPGSWVEAGSFVGEDAVLGADCHLWPNVTVRERCRLGNRVLIHSGTVIGSDGFGYDSSREGHRKVPQLGIVQVDDDVEIGSNTSIDRARFERTWIKRGTKIDNQVQIAHNVIIGEHCIIVSQVGIAGSVEIGQFTVIGGQAGLAGHLKIGNGVTILGGAGVTGDLKDGAQVVGFPAAPRREFFKQMAQQRKIGDVLARLKAVEAELAALRTVLPVDDVAADAEG